MKISFRHVATVTALLFLALALACLILAALGIVELMVCHVTAGILIAVAIEVALAAALLQVASTEKGNT